MDEPERDFFALVVTYVCVCMFEGERERASESERESKEA